MKLDTLINSANPILLDGGIGTELERLGAPMDHEAWCAVALETHPQLVRDVHRSYIDAGADIITVNTYAAIDLHSLELSAAAGMAPQPQGG